MPNMVKRSTGTDPNFAFVYATPQPNFRFCVNPTPQHTHVIKRYKKFYSIVMGHHIYVYIHHEAHLI
jgi:hypothetical protein